MKNIVFLSQEFPASLQALSDLDVPIATAYKIAKIVDEVERCHKRYDKMRVKLAEKYCDRYTEDNDEKGQVAGEPVYSKNNSYKFSDKEKLKQFNDDFNELLNIEFEVSESLNLQELGKDCKIAPKHLLILEALFSDLSAERKKRDDEEAKAEESAEEESDNGAQEATA